MTPATPRGRPAWARRLPPGAVYLVLTGVGALLFQMVFTVAAVYRIQTAHLNPLQLVLLGTALGVSVFVFQVPTGLVADVFSRRLAVITGILLVGAGFALSGNFTLALGLIAQLVSVRAAIAAAGAILLPALLLFARTVRRGTAL